MSNIIIERLGRAMGVGGRLAIDVADGHVVEEAALAALEPRLDAHVGLLAAVVDEPLEAADAVPVALAGAVGGAHHGGHLVRGHAAQAEVAPVDAGEHVDVLEAQEGAARVGLVALGHDAVLLAEPLGLAADDAAIVGLEHLEVAREPRGVVEAHVGVEQDEVGRRAEAGALLLGGGGADVDAVVDVTDVEPDKIGLVVVAVVGVVVDDEDVHGVAHVLAGAAHGAGHLFALVDKGNDEGQLVARRGKGDFLGGHFGLGAGLPGAHLATDALRRGGLAVGVAMADLPVGEAVAHEHVGQVAQLQVELEHTHPEAVVLGVDVVGLVGQAVGADRGGAEHDRGVDEAAAGQHVLKRDAATRAGRVVEAVRRAERDHVAAEEVDVGVGLHVGELQGQPLGHHDVVGVHAGDVLAARLTQ